MGGLLLDAHVDQISSDQIIQKVLYLIGKRPFLLNLSSDDADTSPSKSSRNKTILIQSCVLKVSHSDPSPNLMMKLRWVELHTLY
jgi:hypothetical protein